MTTRTPAPPTAYRSQLARGGDGFGRLLHAEWTKLRTVRRWSIVLLSAVVVTIVVSLLSASGNSVGGGGPDDTAKGPDGTPVADSFRFVHQPLTGDGTVTVRVSGIAPGGGAAAPGDRQMQGAPWAKAGVMVKASLQKGSSYAAVMLTEGRGVRFQYDFTHDVAGSPARGDAPRWLRLTRVGQVLTGYESADGRTWTKVGSAELPGLPQTAEIGMFVTSPFGVATDRSFGSTSVEAFPTIATAHFDSVAVDGRTDGSLRGEDVGSPPGIEGVSSKENGDDGANGAYTVSSSGDTAPLVQDMDLVQQALNGAFAGLIPLAALGVLFITAEYKKGMIRTTFTASPRRGRVLAAKALVLGGTTFAAGVVASVVSFQLGIGSLRDNGFKPPSFPDLSLSDGPVLRAVLGTAAVLALVTVFAMALGALLRSTAAAVTVVIVLLVLPQIVISGLPLGVAKFILLTTPAAGFAIQQTTERYPQVESICNPEDGCYPQGPWTGLAVLAAYTAVALALAVWQTRRRAA
ncbi:MAG: ABC transporter permease subunit [Streptomycetaceae bacterium]|nr:ABC transporter permease subunit [Streptomycetaceae bacterium]